MGMNLVEVKEKLYEATTRFFEKATVIWEEQIATQPPLPYVTLKMNGIKRSIFPIEEDTGQRSYQCSTTVDVNLYTRGLPVTEEEGVTGNFANTAMSDLMQFSNFLESEGMDDFFTSFGIGILLLSPIRDLTMLQNESGYRYRAMAEYAVTFVEEAGGYYGIREVSLVPNSSGGGTKEMAAVEIEPIQEVEIQYEKKSDDK